MRRRAQRALALVAAVAAAGCQARPPEPLAPVPRVSREVLERLRLAEPPQRVGVLGEAGPTASAASERPAAASVARSEGTLALEDLLRAVERHFPLVLAAREEVAIAEGELQRARGAFDTRVGSVAKLTPEGYYEKERVDLLLEQPTTLWGTSFFGGYRLGAGDFAVYDGDLKTNEGGELRVGLRVPLLQGGEIDPRRVALWRARLERERADPLVVQERLDATREAAEAYWRWVSAGQKLGIARRLLALARDRQEQVRAATEEGQLAPIDLVDNRRLIVEREANRVRAERGLQQAAIRLSLYWRDDAGRPVVPAEEVLPPEFPGPRAPAGTIVPEGVELALARRPEVRGLELELQGLRLDLAQARNELLPALDLGLAASRDVGAAANDPDDKGPLELEALVSFSMPLQRSSPKGKRRALQAKIAQLERKVQYVKEVVAADVRDAVSALTQSWERLNQARENATLAAELEEAERLQLSLGQSDLFRVNVREQQTALAAAGLVDVLEEHFRALARYRAELGIPYDEVRAGEAVGGGPLP